MGQVPTPYAVDLQPTEYLLIGSGRLAQHLAYYFQLKSIPLKTWSRQKNSLSELKALAQSPKKVLLAISDDQIEPFLAKNTFLDTSTRIHFSGARSFPHVFSAHPLMTFNKSLYTLSKYESIPFITEQEGPTFHTLFPELSNPAQSIPKEHKALYHSLCVASGNFTSLLWQNISTLFEKKLNLSSELLWPYLRQICNNIETDVANSLTGPLHRGDLKTIESNLQSLEGLPLQKIYQEFLVLHRTSSDASTQETHTPTHHIPTSPTSKEFVL